MVQPVMRSLRRNHGRRCPTNPEREIRETVQSTVDRQPYLESREPAERRPPPNAVRASPERSETRAPANMPQAEPSPRAKRAVGEGRRLAPMVDFTFTPHEAEPEYPTHCNAELWMRILPSFGVQVADHY